MLAGLFKPRPSKMRGAALYQAVVAQARRPEFYGESAIPDRVETRFELYTLHLSLVVLRLKNQGPEAQEISQDMFDAYLKGLDDALREFGVGDLSMAKKMRRIGAQAFERLRIYESALQPEAPENALIDAITASFGELSQAIAARLGGYMRASEAQLARQTLSEILSAHLDWPPVEIK